MKKYLFVAFIIVTMLSNVDGQIVAPAKYDSSIKINYIRTWDALAPITHTDTMLSRSYKDVRQSTIYIDGLGRPVQTVIKKGSLVTGDTARDMVSPIVYDGFGRETYKYLAFAANNTGSNSSISDGLFKLNPFQQDSAFNKELFSDESYFYGKTVFEISSLQRPVQSYAQGDNWLGTASQSNEANRHGVKMKYWLNKVADSVRIWRVTDIPNSFGSYGTDSIYRTALLYKNITQDEHNNQVIEFKDSEGKLILKKVQLSAAADTGTGKNHTGWLCTYYIYDRQNQLRAVLQPKAVELLAASNWSLTNTILDELCFRYEYDGRARMIFKKIPGAGTVYMIYDARDRLVMTQDSSIRKTQKWGYVLYDALNRPTTTGLITDATYYNNAAYHRGQAYTSTNYPNVGSYTNEEMTKTFYDNYGWRSSEGNPLSATRNTTYDSYLYSASNSVWPYPQDATLQSNQLAGMVTGTKIRVLGSANYLYTVSFYDDKSRLTQVQSTNITNGTDVMTTQFAWSGQPLLEISKNENALSASQTTVILTKPTYDDLWRVTKTEEKIATTRVNGGAIPGSWTTINEQYYNALGQLTRKKLGITPIDSLKYEYNIRGWMLGMNRNYVKDTTNTSNWFGFDLGYDKTSITVNGTSHSYTTAQFNGNINGTLWRSAGDAVLRKYDFTYDATNRFTSADFSQLNSNSFSKAAGIDFSVSGMAYDANSNILNMNQKGWKLGGSQTIDSLYYGYNSNSNRLDYVNDKANDSTTYLGDFREFVNNTSQDYVYDGNGSITKDANKKIDTITYNHLNLPDSIYMRTNPTFGGWGYVKYAYDASGNKLSKLVYERLYGSSNFRRTTTTYLNGLVFETGNEFAGGIGVIYNYTDSLMYISTEEGRARIKRDSSAIVYDYMIKDHLGNVRAMLTEEKDTSFYPAATLESSQLAIEQLYYSRVDTGRVNKSTVSGYPTDTYTSPNDYIQKLEPGTFKLGTAIVLKVMAGDKFDLRVSDWWKAPKGVPSNTTSPLTDLLSAIGNSVAGINSGHPGSGTLSGSTELTNSVTTFLNSQSYNTSIPQASVNWILFDEHFKYVSSCSGYEQVGSTASASTVTVHTRTDMPITKNGYLFVYVSNQTQDLAVFFDNLQVTHIRGPLLEENHYYPWGLTMTGISSRALSFGSPENKYKYNKGSELQSKEFSDGSGLELYATAFRSLDPQTGRFWQIDPKPNDAMSLYASMENNPIRYNDPLGDSILPNVTYDYAGTATPKKQSDLGNTTDTYIGITSATTTKINITVDISISLSSSFKGATPGTNIEKQNPGLEREVKAHEEGHKDQIMDAANKPITISLKIDGKKTSFTGTADQVMVNATTAFSKSAGAAGMSIEDKSSFINNKIGSPALAGMSKNIDKAMKSNKALETDANNRAAATLGASTMKYNSGINPVMFNGIQLK